LNPTAGRKLGSYEIVNATGTPVQHDDVLEPFSRCSGGLKAEIQPIRWRFSRVCA